MQVQEIMTKNVVKIDSDKSVLDACKKFSELKVGSLVVMSNDIVVGIITERDIIENIILVKGDPKKSKVREIMSSQLKTIHAMDPLEKAASIMKEYKIKKLPVILNNEIVGIITETDLSQTIDAFSFAIDELTELYYNSKETLEKVIDDWGNIIVGLKSYKKLPEKKHKIDVET